jgi:hypothetical protein
MAEDDDPGAGDEMGDALEYALELIADGEYFLVPSIRALDETSFIAGCRALSRSDRVRLLRDLGVPPDRVPGQATATLAIASLRSMEPSYCHGVVGPLLASVVLKRIANQLDESLSLEDSTSVSPVVMRDALLEVEERLPVAVQRVFLAYAISHSSEFAAASWDLLVFDDRFCLAEWDEVARHVGGSRDELLAAMEERVGAALHDHSPEGEDIAPEDGTTNVETDERVAIGDLSTYLTNAVEAARRTLAQLEARSMPSAEDVSVVNDVERRFREVAVRVGLEDGPTTLADLEAALQARTVSEETTTLDTESLQVLTTLRGPSDASLAIEEVRAAASHLVEMPTDEFTDEDLSLAAALGDLVRLIQAVKDEDESDIVSLDQKLRGALPAVMSPLLIHAIRGRVSIGEMAETPAVVVEAIDSNATEETLKGSATVDPVYVTADPVQQASRREPSPALPATGPSSNIESASEPSSAEGGAEPATEPWSEGLESSVAPEEALSVVPTGEATRVDEDLLQNLVRLIGKKRFALARWLEISYSGSLEVESPRARVYGICALVQDIASSTGECAIALQALAEDLVLSDLPDDRGTQLLGLIASLRGCLIAPYSGLQPMVASLRMAFNELPALQSLSEVFLKAATRGVELGPQLILETQGLAGLDEELAQVRAEAKRQFEEAPSRKLVYQRATSVWHDWMKPTGFLASGLAPVIQDDRDRMKDVRSWISVSRTRLEDEIHRTDARLRSKAHREPITSRARTSLMEKASEVINLAETWLSLASALAIEEAKEKGWQKDLLMQLRRAVGEHGGRALAELVDAGMATDLSRVSADAASDLARATYELVLDGTGLRESELPALDCLNADLLLAPDVAMRGLAPVGVVRSEDVLAAADNPSWVDAFRDRCERGDHIGSGQIVEVLRRRGIPGFEELEMERASAIERDRATWIGNLAACRRDLEEARRRGLLSEASAAELEGRLLSLELNDDRLDFDQMSDEAGAIRQEIRDRRGEGRQRFLDHLGQRLTGIPRPRAVEQRVLELVEQDDLATAEELLVLAENGLDLPSGLPDADDFSMVFPEVVTSLLQSPVDGRVVHAARTGRVENAIDFSQLNEDRREAVAEALESWLSLAAQEAAPDGRLLRRLSPVLRHLGIDADHESRPAGLRSRSDRIWLDLSGFRPRGKPMVPTFGSDLQGSLRLLLCWQRPSEVAMLDLLRQDNSGRPVLVLYFGVLSLEQRQVVADECRPSRMRRSVGLIDDAVITFLAMRKESSYESTMRCILPFVPANPFRPHDAGNVPEEMFYGRSAELDQVTAQLGGSSFIYGGRQLGKSALLRAAVRAFQRVGSHKAIYIDLLGAGVGTALGPDSIWRLLWEELATAGVVKGGPPPTELASELARATEDWLNAAEGRRLLVLLDESDRFLDADSEAVAFANVLRLKELMERTGRRFKVVFAGLHQVQRFNSIPNQPFAHLGRPIVVGPLTPGTAFDLLVQPLAALGYRFESDDLVNRVLAYSNYQPSIIQLFGDALVRHMLARPIRPGSEGHLITAKDVEDSYASSDLRERIRERFEWTLALDPRYKVIAYVVAYATMEHGTQIQLPMRRIREDAEEWWPAGFSTVTRDEFRALLEEMVGLGVLTRLEDGAYRLRSLNVLPLLGTPAHIEEQLLEAVNLAMPKRFEPASYRRPLTIGGRAVRSPLTEAQLQQLLRPGEVQVVFGATAMNVGLVQDVLKKAGEGEFSVTIRSGKAKPGAVAGRLDAGTAERPLVVVFNARGLGQAQFGAVLEECRSGVRAFAHSGIILLTRSEDLPVLRKHLSEGVLDEASLVTLGPWNSESLQTWVAEADLPFQGDVGLQTLLDATGGWPILVDEIVENWRSARDQSPHLAVLDDPGRASDFVRSTGLKDDPVLRQAWSLLAELALPGGAAEYAEVLAGDGLEDPLLLVALLRAIGALAPAGGGNLQPEPVLLRAWSSGGQE